MENEKNEFSPDKLVQMVETLQKDVAELAKKEKQKKEKQEEEDKTRPEWIDKDGGIIEPRFIDYMLEDRALVCVNNRLYDIDREISDAEMDKEILREISIRINKCISRKTTELRKALKTHCWREPFPVTEDRVHFKNGTYFTQTGFVESKEWTSLRLSSNYNEEAEEPIIWKEFLNELLYEEDILTLQEFMGYCMIPCNRGQCMLLMIGKGGEGKSRIGRVMKSIFGAKMNSGSIMKLETDRFALADQEGKLVFLDDDIKMEALPSTNTIKRLITLEDEIDLERKGEQSYQGKLYCRIMAFGNGTLQSLYDKSDGFYRSQIILMTKDKPKNREDDPYLGDKLCRETEGIVLWCLEGLERLLKNNFRFTISIQSDELMKNIKEDEDSVLSFLGSTGYIKLEPNTRATTANLYKVYSKWCEDNLEQPVSNRTFSKRLKSRSQEFGLTYERNINLDNNKAQRGYIGIHTLIRT